MFCATVFHLSYSRKVICDQCLCLHLHLNHNRTLAAQSDNRATFMKGCQSNMHAHVLLLSEDWVCVLQTFVCMRFKEPWKSVVAFTLQGEKFWMFSSLINSQLLVLAVDLFPKLSVKICSHKHNFLVFAVQARPILFYNLTWKSWFFKKLMASQELNSNNNSQ